MPSNAYTTARDSPSGTWACSHALPTVDSDAVIQRDVTFRDATAGSRLLACLFEDWYFIYIYACMTAVEGYVHVCGCLWREERVSASGAGVTGGSAPSNVSAEGPNSGPLKEQQVHLTSEPSLAPSWWLL